MYVIACEYHKIYKAKIKLAGTLQVFAEPSEFPIDIAERLPLSRDEYTREYEFCS